MAIEIRESEIKRQKDIMRRVAEKNRCLPNKSFAYVDTYGCQQNESDSELLRGMLCEMGYEITWDEFNADVVVINSCAIRKNAENRVFGNVGALVHTKKEKKSQIIAFCGCMAGIDEHREKIRDSYKHVKLVFSPQSLWRFPELLERAMTERGCLIAEIEGGAIAEGLPAHRDGTIKAWLPIMYGCDNFCSYCIVPYVRDRERSRRATEVLRDASELIKHGYKDICLLGQNVNSYGKRSENGVDFSDLLKSICAIEGDYLLRFMTSHPKDAGERLFETMAENLKIARHIHLPFQAGSDSVLKAMNRGYSAEQYLDKIRYARQCMPDIVITSDVIVGFPGESESDFDDTMRLITQAQFDAMFTFIYSPRPGTKAAALEDSVTREEKQERFDKLIELQNSISLKKHLALVGKSMKVLVDGKSEDERYNLKARTNGGRLVHLCGGDELLGSFCYAEVTDANPWSLYGVAKE